eukprot:COSAG04_NODE_1970_length_5110_cov_7.302734_4_plen_75_part_00
MRTPAALAGVARRGQMRVHRRRLVVRAVDERVGQGDAADCDIGRVIEDEQLPQRRQRRACPDTMSMDDHGTAMA